MKEFKAPNVLGIARLSPELEALVNHPDFGKPKPFDLDDEPIYTQAELDAAVLAGIESAAQRVARLCTHWTSPPWSGVGHFAEAACRSIREGDMT